MAAAVAPPLRRLVRRAAALYLASRRPRSPRARALLLAVPPLLLLATVLALHARLTALMRHPPASASGDQHHHHHQLPPPSRGNDEDEDDLPHMTDPEALSRVLSRVAFTPSALHTLNLSSSPSSFVSRPLPRLVVATALNYPFRAYLHNLFCSMRRSAPIPAARLLVVSLDRSMHLHATRHGFDSILLPAPSATMPPTSASDVHTFGSPAFNLLSKRKLYAVSLLLRAGVDVLFSDADVVWCADASNAISHAMYHDSGVTRPQHQHQHPQPHLLMQTAWPRSLLNSGFYYVRADDDSVALFDAFLRYDASDAENDQVVLNRVLCRPPYGGQLVFHNDSRSHPAAPHRPLPLLCRWRGRADARVLDPRRYPTGGEIFEERKIFHLPREKIVGMCERRDVDVLHNNCILSEKKLARFVVKGLWWVALREGKCRLQPAPPTLEARRRCGVSKCGEDGDYRSFVPRRHQPFRHDGKPTHHLPSNEGST